MWASKVIDLGFVLAAIDLVSILKDSDEGEGDRTSIIQHGVVIDI